MKTEDILELPKVSRAAELSASTFNADKNTIDVVFTTGATVARRTWSGRYNEELVVTPESVRLGRLNAGAPFLDTHDDFSIRGILGSVVRGSARVENGQGLATVQLSRRPDAAGAVQDIRDGVLRNVSVGYRYHAVDRTEATASAPEHWRVTDWEPLEISAVPVPADAGAQIRADAKEAFPCIMKRVAPTVRLRPFFIWPEQLTAAQRRARMAALAAGLPV